MSSTKKSLPKERILQTLAVMLETEPGNKITTANLAKGVGVSEAALYKHFPSKAKMLEALIEFIEETIFSRTTLIINEPSKALEQCHKIMSLLLTFAERNPGITRLLTKDVLVGEKERLHQRINQFFDRIETQLKQVLRQAEIQEGMRTQISVTATANLLIGIFNGKISQFVRSAFKQKPTLYWQDQWQQLSLILFVHP